MSVSFSLTEEQEESLRARQQKQVEINDHKNSDDMRNRNNNGNNNNNNNIEARTMFDSTGSCSIKAENDPIRNRFRSSFNEKSASLRGQSVFVRPKEEMSAMSWEERAKTRFKNFLEGGDAGVGGRSTNDNGEGINNNSIRHAPQTGNRHTVMLEDNTLQYRLEATRKYQTNNYFFKFLLCFGLCESKGTADSSIGVPINQQLTFMLHWMFRVNFMFLFSLMCVMFFACVVFFSAFICIAGALDEKCVMVGGKSFGSGGAKFIDAFALSWTTFSTVGYGSTSPALGHQNDSYTNCFFVTFICSLEALFGVLYSGLCGAILFGKVLRIQSHAQVIFSDPIVIRYGDGVKEPNQDDIEAGNNAYYNGRSSITSNNSNHDTNSNQETTPCPILEFRIVNRLYDEQGGEIMDATLNLVAHTDVNDADPDAEGSDLDKNCTFDSSSSQDMGDIISNHNSFLLEGRLRQARIQRAKSINQSIFGGIIAKFDHEDVTDVSYGSRNGPGRGTATCSKSIFTKLVIEGGEHPFFKRIWVARHTLDETSPLLKPRVRRHIRNNGGSWPKNFSSHEAVRKSLQFKQILVSLNGVSNVSASDVYAQKIYEFDDINVGYQFVNILYRDTGGSLKVDTDLLNDVIEQHGGGGEPFNVDY